MTAGARKVWQTTIAAAVDFAGVGVHSGRSVNLRLLPAPADSGVRFVRTDLPRFVGPIPALHERTTSTELATVLGDPEVGAVSTVEHVMATLYGLGVDNCLVEIDGPETPILDGSAAEFVAGIDAVGVVELDEPRRYIEVLKPVRVESGDQFGELSPFDGFRVDVEIAFEADVIGRQRVVIDVTPDSFRRDLSRARTFGFMRDVERLWGAGYALGASLDNTVVVGEGAVVNAEGLRWRDEFVRHKALDAVGDLALAGMPLLGAFRSSRGGHRLNAKVLAALLADPTAWRIVEPLGEPVRRAPARSGAYAISPAAAPDR
jgi:UDP-3-O-[3-hydroxymyristoyl] N-acetylglucosamine deacetylase